eukprot:455555_1
MNFLLHCRGEPKLKYIYIASCLSEPDVFEFDIRPRYDQPTNDVLSEEDSIAQPPIHFGHRSGQECTGRHGPLSDADHRGVPSCPWPVALPLDGSGIHWAHFRLVYHRIGNISHFRVFRHGCVPSENSWFFSLDHIPQSSFYTGLRFMLHGILDRVDDIPIFQAAYVVPVIRRIVRDGGRPIHAHDGHVDRRVEFHALSGDVQSAGAYTCHGWDIQVLASPGIRWLVLVDGRDSDADGQSDLPGGLSIRIMEVLSVANSTRRRVPDTIFRRPIQILPEARLDRHSIYEMIERFIFCSGMKHSSHL